MVFENAIKCFDHRQFVLYETKKETKKKLPFSPKKLLPIQSQYQRLSFDSRNQGLYQTPEFLICPF